jgi:putative transposase
MILVDKDEYLLELARYLLLNPVRAGMVESPEEYAWSSYRVTTGEDKAPDILTTDWLLARFDERRRKAQRRFTDFVKEGMKTRTSPLAELKGQIYLGDESFVESLLREISGSRDKLQEVPKKQKFASRPGLSELFKGSAWSDKKERNLAIFKAHVGMGYKLQEIADYLNMHYASISRIVVQVEKGMLKYKT